MSTLPVLWIVVGFFLVVQWGAAWFRDVVHRGIEPLPSLLPHLSGDPLATEIDPPCGDVTYAVHFNHLPPMAFY
jgi:hypothetical protein